MYFITGTLRRISRATGERRFHKFSGKIKSRATAIQRKKKGSLEEISRSLKASGGKRAISTAIGPRFQRNRLELSGKVQSFKQKSFRDRGKGERVLEKSGISTTTIPRFSRSSTTLLYMILII